jgi:uncharacterized protein (UPF0276 family)
MTIPAGVGIGLRAGLFAELMAAPPDSLAFVELTPENYLGRGGRYAAMLSAAVQRWPVVTHGLSLSLGGPDPLDVAHLRKLGDLLHHIGAPWHSDHLSFGAVDSVMLHELLPVPFTREAVRHVAERIAQAQEILRLPLAVENITYYATGTGSEMDEADFVNEVLRATGARLLLDVNNVYVNSKNHGFDARASLERMPLDRVVQIHVAGHDRSDPALLVDTHAEPVDDEVYALLGWVLERTGPKPVLLERDDQFPPWAELCAEMARLHAIVQAAARPRGRGEESW